MLSHDEMLADDMGRFYADPLGFVVYAYEWGRGELSGFDGPDVWQAEFLRKLGREVRQRGFDGINPVEPIRTATASGHGIGKSALTAWLCDWIMSTRPYAVGTITANTFAQLKTKTWAQIAVWTKRCITGHWFDVSSTGLWMRHKEHPDSWHCEAQTCREENSESFAGQHNAGSTSFYIFDEASAVPDKIWEVAEGGLTDGEPMFFAFGNPTRNTGAFKGCFTGPQASRWKSEQIDSRACKLPNKELIKEWARDYGEDSDFFKVRVRGVFPAMSAKQFISVSDVDAAFGRHLRTDQYDFAPKILCVDPAWEGDDELVIGLRQGLAFSILRTIPKNDNDIQVAAIVANLEDEHCADAVFIDAGYGTGIVSAGRTLGRSWQLVWFAGESSDPGCLNKRAEMWKLMRDWLKAGGAIPSDSVLYNDLIGPETVARMDGKIQIEPKDAMKRRGLQSPNRADCLAISFAYPVSARRRQNAKPAFALTEYDPLEERDNDGGYR